MTQAQIALFETFAEMRITPGNRVKQTSSDRFGTVLSMKEMAAWTFEVMFTDGSIGLFKEDEIEAA